MVPTDGLNDQVTDVLDVPLTEAVNCWVCEALSDDVEGVTETATVGFRLTVAPADLVPSATLVAVTVTDCALAIDAGAV